MRLQPCVAQALLLPATATVGALLAAVSATQHAVRDAGGASGGGFALGAVGPQQQACNRMEGRL